MKSKRTALAVRTGSKKSAAAAVPGKAADQQLEQTPAPAHEGAGFNARQLTLGKIGCECTDTESPEVGFELIGDICDIFKIGAPSGDPNEQAVCGLLMLREIEPKGIFQSLLAIQAVAVHRAAMSCLRTAFANTSGLGLGNALVNQATRLMGLFVEQVDAMARLKGTVGQQKVTVEHVHVNAGGQAIVGAVSAPKGEGGGGQ
jgi:hypothetical protein